MTVFDRKNCEHSEFGALRIDGPEPSRVIDRRRRYGVSPCFRSLWIQDAEGYGLGDFVMASLMKWMVPTAILILAAIVDANTATAQYIAGWGPYYQPQFQYTPPTFMSSQPTQVPWYAHTPTLAESEAVQNAAAIDQSAQVFLGIDNSDKQSEQQYGSKFPAKPLVTPQSTRAVASAAAPHRLTASQYDRTHRIINWPLELRDPKFDDVRFQLDKLFHELYAAKQRRRL